MLAIGLRRRSRVMEPTVTTPDRAAFDRLFEEFSSPIYNYVLRMVGDPDRAADVTQDTFIKAYRKLDSLTDEYSTKSWLYRIATNLVRDSRRRARHATVPLDEPEATPLAREGDPVHATGDRTDVQRALARLKERDQQLLWLAYAEGSTHQEVAASLGLRASSVKTLLFRARQRLAALLPRTRAPSWRQQSVSTGFSRRLTPA